MKGYSLTANAQLDLVRIRDYYLEKAGSRTARRILTEYVEAFRLLAATPGAGHARSDLAGSRPIRFWAVREYLILYRPETQPLQILTIVHGNRDVPTIIGRQAL